jgi:hypothetical protein
VAALQLFGMEEPFRIVALRCTPKTTHFTLSNLLDLGLWTAHGANGLPASV